MIAPKRSTTPRTSKTTKKTVKKVTKRRTAKAAKKVTSRQAKSSVLGRAQRKATSKKSTQKTARKVVTAKKPKRVLKPKSKATLPGSNSTDKVLGFPRSIALAVMAIPKLPVDIDAMAVSLARYGGISIVVIGALLTYVHAAALGLLPGSGQSATAINGTSSELQASSENVDFPAVEPPTIDQRKDQVEFDFGVIESPDSLATKKIAIDVYAPDAFRVDVTVFSDQAQHFQVIGSAHTYNNKDWEIVWDTSAYPAGEYEVVAILFYDSGNFEVIAPEPYKLEPTPVTPPESVDSSNDGGTGDSVGIAEEVSPSEESGTDPLLTKPRLTVPAAGAIVTGSVRIEAVFPEYEGEIQFKLLANDGTTTTIDRDRVPTADRFRVQFDTTRVVNDEYVIVAIASVDGNMVKSEAIPVVVRNLLAAEKQPELPESEEEAAVATTTAPVNEPVAGTDSNLDGNDFLPESTLQTVSISTPRPDVAAGVVPLTVSASQPVTAVELFARRSNTQQANFIGTARLADDETWTFFWNTFNTPNGEYVLFARVHYEGTQFFSERTVVSVQNEPLLPPTADSADTAAPQTVVPGDDDAGSTHAERERTQVEVEDSTAALQSDDVQFEQPYHSESLDVSGSAVLASVDVPDKVTASAADEVIITNTLKNLLTIYQDDIDELFKTVRTAVRSGDQTAINEAKRQIRLLKDEIVSSAGSEAISPELVTVFENRLQRQLAAVTLRTEQAERIVRDRVGDEISTDTDGDGITDFDERNVFNTDPTVADSDNDGFLDGVEILNGYDPLDSRPQSEVAFESPKVAGAVREDVFSVTTITTLPEPEVTAEAVRQPTALIAGTGLPNSFVTLFIFSKPVVVTVKTNQQGNWSYTFDKELEDGTHEIYVGITDNAGRVVAKGESVTFVKTAQAFSVVDASDTSVVVGYVESDSLLTTNLLLLVASISVVSIGVILVLLGLHLKTRPKDFMSSQATAGSAAPLA